MTFQVAARYESDDAVVTALEMDLINPEPPHHAQTRLNGSDEVLSWPGTTCSS